MSLGVEVKNERELQKWHGINEFILDPKLKHGIVLSDHFGKDPLWLRLVTARVLASARHLRYAHFGC